MKPTEIKYKGYIIKTFPVGIKGSESHIYLNGELMGCTFYEKGPIGTEARNPTDIEKAKIRIDSGKYKWGI